MAWKIYTKNDRGSWEPVPGSWKSQQDAELYYRRNMTIFRKPDGSYQKPLYVNQGKGSK